MTKSQHKKLAEITRGWLSISLPIKKGRWVIVELYGVNGYSRTAEIGPRGGTYICR